MPPEDKKEGTRVNGLKKTAIDKSKWVTKETPQDTGVIPTVGVMLWLGWMGVLVHMSVFMIFFGRKYIWTTSIFLSLCSLSIMLPRTFLGELGERIGGWIMIQASKYFGLKTTLEDSEAIKNITDKAIIFALEPHDLLPYTIFCFNPYLHRIPGKAGETSCALMTSAVFHMPFIKQVYTWVGGHPVDKKTFMKRLENKQSLAFVPGGVQEVTMLDPTKPEDVVLFLKSRKGFVKLALQTGSPIVPVFAFNTDGSYGFFTPKSKFFESLSRKIGFAPMIFWGRFNIPFGIPFSRKIHVVVGAPIEIPKVEKEEEMGNLIDEYHSLFLREMEALYERHKADNGYEHRNLAII